MFSETQHTEVVLLIWPRLYLVLTVELEIRVIQVVLVLMNLRYDGDQLRLDTVGKT